jgi:superoxide dismutase, Fe-Mn family
MSIGNQMAPASLAPPMALALASNFGSVEKWFADVAALAEAHAAAGGAIRLAFDAHSGTLGNHWLLDAAAPDTSTVLLTIARPLSDDALADLDWPLAYQRYQDAVHAASERFAAHDAAGMLVLDVRRAGVFEAAPTMLPGAVWHDPAAVGAWAGRLPADRPVLVYCVYGHEVGRVTAMRLQALGVDAGFLVGGIDAWQRAGRATVAKPGAAQ